MLLTPITEGMTADTGGCDRETVAITDRDRH